MLVPVEEYRGDTVGSRPYSCIKAGGAISQLSEVFWFPRAYKCYVYTVLCLLIVCTVSKKNSVHSLFYWQKMLTMI